MRMILRATMDTQKSSELIKNGKMPEILKTMMEQLKPEAAYFTPDKGRRSCVIVFDMDDPSQLPVITEPLYAQAGAEISVQPCMNLEDLQRGLAAIGNR
ncbi:DUF3303 family protein [Streptomyces sp. TRM64462]|uniref:DUF3303 family protein n=1 Tax=Streptomyces sp. TRM64462 TaxID=2741726 RepID=UPI00158681F3|nr:DUF3303 family protein [Streptomyces sp. TRM64462]